MTVTVHGEWEKQVITKFCGKVKKRGEKTKKNEEEEQNDS